MRAGDTEERDYIRMIAALSAGTLLLIIAAFIVARAPSDIMSMSLIAGTRVLADSL